MSKYLNVDLLILIVGVIIVFTTYFKANSARKSEEKTTEMLEEVIRTQEATIKEVQREAIRSSASLGSWIKFYPIFEHNSSDGNYKINLTMKFYGQYPISYAFSVRLYEIGESSGLKNHYINGREINSHTFNGLYHEFNNNILFTANIKNNENKYFQIVTQTRAGTCFQDLVISVTKDKVNFATRVVNYEINVESSKGTDLTVMSSSKLYKNISPDFPEQLLIDSDSDLFSWRSDEWQDISNFPALVKGD